MRTSLIVLAFSALSLPAFAAPEVEPASPVAAKESAAPKLWIVLDDEASSADRVQELNRLRAAAEAGDHAARCTMGRLGIAGKRHPAKFPEFDFGDANSWLSRCVIGGDLDAMLVMAELKLIERKPLDAMIWMQGYLKMASALAPETINNASSYKAGILARIERAYGSDRPSNEEVLEYTAGFLDQFGERIAQGFKNGGMASFMPLPAYAEIDPKARTSSLAGRFTRDSTSAEDELVYASFLIEVAPNGKPAKVMTFETYPDEGASRKLRGHAVSRRFLSGEGARWYYSTVFIDNKAFDLLPDASSDRRPAR